MTYGQWVLQGHVSPYVHLELVFDSQPNNPRDNDLRSHTHGTHNQALASVRLYLLLRLSSGNHEQSGQAKVYANQQLQDEWSRILSTSLQILQI